MILKESPPPFQLLDLSPHSRKLPLHFKRIGDISRLLHDFEELRFKSFLGADSCFKINEFFSDILSCSLLLQDTTANLSNLFDSCFKLCRRDSRNYSHNLRVVRPARALLPNF